MALTGEAVGQLVLLAQRGDEGALSALVGAFLRPAYVVALSMVGRPADAEDVAQDALVSALEKLHSCREPQRFAAWLLQIVRNRARNFLDYRRLREAPTGPQQVVGEEGHLGHTPELRLREELLKALEQLPRVQREVVLLHDLEEWTHGEISQALEISEGMSRQHLFHARRTLRQQLGAFCVER